MAKKKKKANRTLTKIGSAVQNKVNKVYSYNSLFSPVNTKDLYTMIAQHHNNVCDEYCLCFVDI